jgi:hypothetical protein
VRVWHWLKRLWRVVGAISTLAWLLSLGVGSVVSAILGNLVGLKEPSEAFFLVGILLATFALSMPFSQWAITRLSLALAPPRTEVQPTVVHQTVDQGERERIRKLRTLCALAASEMRTNIRLLQQAQQRGRYCDPADDRLTTNYLEERSFATEPLTKMALEASELAGEWIAAVNGLAYRKAHAMREAIGYTPEPVEVHPPVGDDDLDTAIHKLRLAEKWFDSTAHELDEKL